MFKEVIGFVRRGYAETMKHSEAIEKDIEQTRKRIDKGRKQMDEWQPRLIKQKNGGERQWTLVK